MGEQDSTHRLTGDQMKEPKENGTSVSQFSTSVRAMVRIRQKYLAIKKRRMESALSSMSSHSHSPKYFTFESFPEPASPHKRKKKRKTRILYPSNSLRAVPTKERSRAKNCLYLLCIIVFLQVYNAIENLDDHVLKYDLEGLENTLKREVFGQQEVTEGILGHLQDYLSTYVHNKPLVLSLHGATGVGKSHVGRLLAQHFRSVVGDQLVMQYFVLHHCPTDDDIPRCTTALDTHISEMVTQAEEVEKIPLFIFDDVEHMPRELLDTLQGLIRPQNNNEYLNAIYILIGNLGHEEITKFVLHNSSVAVSGRLSLSQELTPWLRSYLQRYHSLFLEAEFLPFTLLEKSHVKECFIDKMSQEGFYPDRQHVERLAEELSYYTVGKWKFSHTGCRQVVAKVNLL
ncbi:torsin-4A-like [Myxocyprinus asiaticus]|uniref:torsin-4A-like n=1 Tax=Myxocyprinus asiaticus TaxID=70543 RepID=UPI0022231770|nr:torsin-4A-like [Myxocyprinus asiaticus]